MHEIDYRALWRRILLRWLSRIIFFIHVVLFLLLATNPFYRDLGHIFFVWFLIVVLHGLWAFGILGNFMRRQIEREAERLRAQGYTVRLPQTRAEKPKRAARLVDDGEIVFDADEFDADDYEADDAPRTTRRKMRD